MKLQSTSNRKRFTISEPIDLSSYRIVDDTLLHPLLQAETRSWFVLGLRNNESFVR